MAVSKNMNRLNFRIDGGSIPYHPPFEIDKKQPWPRISFARGALKCRPEPWLFRALQTCHNHVRNIRSAKLGIGSEQLYGT
jgi:hypothetical protein